MMGDPNDSNQSINVFATSITLPLNHPIITHFTPSSDLPVSRHSRTPARAEEDEDSLHRLGVIIP